MNVMEHTLAEKKNQNTLAIGKFKEQITLLRATVELHDRLLAKTANRAMLGAVAIGTLLEFTHSPLDLSPINTAACYAGVILAFAHQIKSLYQSWGMHKKVKQIEKEVHNLSDTLKIGLEPTIHDLVERSIGNTKVLAEIEHDGKRVQEFNRWLALNKLVKVKDFKNMPNIISSVYQDFNKLSQELLQNNPITLKKSALKF